MLEPNTASPATLEQPVGSEIDDTRELERLIRLQRAILSDVTLDMAFDEVLNKLCRLIEEMVPHGMASVMRMDPSDGLLYVAAGPSFPPIAIERFLGYFRSRYLIS